MSSKVLHRIFGQWLKSLPRRTDSTALVVVPNPKEDEPLPVSAEFWGRRLSALEYFVKLDGIYQKYQCPNVSEVGITHLAAFNGPRYVPSPSFFEHDKGIPGTAALLRSDLCDTDTLWFCVRSIVSHQEKHRTQASQMMRKMLLGLCERFPRHDLQSEEGIDKFLKDFEDSLPSCATLTDTPFGQETTAREDEEDFERLPRQMDV